MRRVWLLLVGGAVLLLVVWVAHDLLRTRRADLRDFDPQEVARLETELWRAYYEHRRTDLFAGLVELLQFQFRAPYWESVRLATLASRAAVTFQAGSSRAEYEAARPDLEAYYAGIAARAEAPFDPLPVAHNELEWWILRRERDRHPPEEWVELIAQNAATMYHVPVERTRPHASLRVEAMLRRDEGGRAMTEADWGEVGRILQESWTALRDGVR